ncbi:Aste57867_15178 [Aphanomyces stellatus]|uniref:tRNA pseudouridine synthase n=1 Tax=Aphanomyces stellatus TaxID=120398 RepID=A0A485L4C9_9STRA|nr:hypothetical protein As57867_015122 [Aphanomyces stellatus]VFT91987.1 Aste57867_15178 [Aphanomyces stellatus]
MDCATSSVEPPAVLPQQPLDTRMKFLLMVSYYGRGYVGWQRQSARDSERLVSVQDVMEAAVSSQFFRNEKINVTSVSRTDSGTNALQQYCTFVLDRRAVPWTTDEMRTLLNAVLPESIRVQTLVVLDPVVARRRTKSTCKKYIYYIEQGPRPSAASMHTAWFIGKHLNLPAMRAALALVTGTFDFRVFSQGLQKDIFAGLNTTRTILEARVVARRSVDFSLDVAVAGTGVEIDDPEDTTQSFYVCVEITGNGFLRHMVRRIMGTLRPIGEGRLPPEVMLEVLAGRQEPGPSVPSRGLWLHQSWMTQSAFDAESAVGEDDDE